MNMSSSSASEIQQNIISEEARSHLKCEFKHLGLHQERRYKKCSMCMGSHHCMFVFRLALRYQLKYHGAKLTPEEAQVIENKFLVIENKRGCLQKLIDKFQLQADTFIHHQHGLWPSKDITSRWLWSIWQCGQLPRLRWGGGWPLQALDHPWNFRWFNGPHVMF